MIAWTDMNSSRKGEIIIEAESEINDLIPRMKGIHGHFIMERDYTSIRNLALAANQIKSACMRIMRTYDNVDPEQKLRDYNLLDV